jgi:hypothetical protein
MKTPDQITSCKFWLAARDIIPTSNPFGQVSSVTDYFGETLTNGSATAPLAVRSHGYAALHFDGTMGLASTHLAINPSTAVVLAVTRWASPFSASVSPFGLNGSSDSAGSLIAAGPTYQYYYAGAAGLQGAPTDFNVRVPKEIHLAGFINSGGQTLIQVNGLRGAAITNTYSTTSAGVLLGQLPAHGTSFNWAGDFYEGVILDNPSAADIRDATNYLNATYNLPTPPPTLEYPLIAIDGNSVAEGWVCSSVRTTWWAQMLRSLNMPCELRVTAKGGLTTPQLTTLLPRDVYPLYDEKRRLTIYLCWEFINDRAGGSTVSQAWANTVALYQAARANMPNALLVIPTIQPSSEVSDADRVAYNALVYANWSSYADLLWDIAADPAVGQAGQNVAPNYNSGGTHLADPGAAIFGKSLAKLLNSSVFAGASAYSNGGSSGY